MNNYLLGFPNKKERDDFLIAIVVILFFIFLFSSLFNRGPKLDMSAVPVVEVVAEDTDADNDGIFDKDDKCPNLAGTKRNNGCPSDGDGDGIYDDMDRCPELAGTKANNGCPSDSDGDGVYDKDDACPKIHFTSESGCPPDTDGDGVFDSDDKCPNVKGKPENEGCPFTKKERAVIQDISSSVEFETGSANLTRASISKLDQLVAIIKRHPSIKMNIHGHTDATGDKVKNLQLSKDRARSCLEYLIGNGISISRLRSNGFGESKPIATNSTDEGREKNRRVEFISF